MATMVDRIERPEPPPSYRIDSTASTKDDRGRQPQSQQEDEFSNPGTPVDLRRIQRTAQDRQLLKIPREQVQRIGFRRVTLTRQAILLEIDLELENGKIFRGAQTVIPRLDEFPLWKGYVPGQDVPPMALLREPTIEVSVPMDRSTVPVEAKRVLVEAEDQTRWRGRWYPGSGIGSGIGALFILLRRGWPRTRAEWVVWAVAFGMIGLFVWVFSYLNGLGR